MITQAPRGTADWYGSEMYKRQIIEKVCSETAARFNIKQIHTPIFEHTVLFSRGVGETTDVVQKEMYTFEDKGKRSITLKPEGTAGVIRAYLEHGMFAEGGITKLFYFTPAFRYEKPQSGRLRQHHQFGVEYIGSKSPLAEAELIVLVRSVLETLGLRDFKVHINSIGCEKCRKEYNRALLEYLESHKDGLCNVCLERMEKNPLRVIDCKDEGCKKIVENAPRTIDYLDDECKKHFEDLQKLLDELQIPYEIDTGIVRGLDYYTKTVFEFISKEGLTLCGGGRYDRLVHEIDGKQDIPAAGFGLGIERLLYFLDLRNIEFESEKTPDLFVGIMGDNIAAAYKIVNRLRSEGFIVETEYLGRSVKGQMKYANKIGAKHVVIIGDNEADTGVLNVKNMSDGSNTEISVDNITDIFKMV